MTQYVGFGQKLHHDIPPWVEPGSVFHIRIRCAPENPIPLTEPSLAAMLLDSVRFYRGRKIWHPALFLLMPDHLHALLSITPDRRMSRVIGDWKRFHASRHGIRWQENYFDHRVRDDAQLGFKYEYILRNPVVKGFCAKPEEWPWKLESSEC